jgi:hypothetical protein
MEGNGAKAIASNEIRRKTPVRVKLRRLSLNYGKLYPPDGEAKHWWRALKAALGTTSSAFVDASLAQLQGAARLPDGPVSEMAINAALALIQAMEPRNEIEGALAVQMACTHLTAMAVLSRIGSALRSSIHIGLFDCGGATAKDLCTPGRNAATHAGKRGATGSGRPTPHQWRITGRHRQSRNQPE